MKKQLSIGSFVIFLISCIPLFGQPEQQRKDIFPTVSTEIKNSVQLDRFSVQISVLGNIAITTYDMTFINSENRVLEGQMEFPLQEGEQVIGYQLEVNGKMRKGVVVEKEEARQVFEEVVNRRVDPGIIEKTQGNNYRTRLYPIPANGTKRVIITSQQVLYKQNEQYNYIFPLYSKTVLSEFNLEMTIYNQDFTPILIQNSFFDFIFSKKNRDFYSSFKLAKKALNEPFTINIPCNSKKDNIIFETFDSDRFFLAKCFLDSALFQNNNNFNPDSIFILWDISLSGLTRDLKKEKEFLAQLVTKYPNKVVTFIPFSNKIFSPSSLISSDSEQLQKILNELIYDGATNLNVLEQLNIKPNNLSLIFSDGINSLGEDFSSKTNLGTAFCIVSSSSNDYTKLNSLSHKNILNLGKMSFDNCNELIRKIPLRVISIEKSDKITDLTLKINDEVMYEFMLSGKVNTDFTTVKILFGYTNVPIYTKTLELIYSDSTDIAFNKSNISNVVSRFWAQNMIDDLFQNLPKSKNKIKYLSRKHNIITDFTSLIVLETVADYYRYHIQPPEDLMVEFDNYARAYGKNSFSNSNTYPTIPNKDEIITKDYIYVYKPFINWYNPSLVKQGVTLYPFKQYTFTNFKDSTKTTTLSSHSLYFYSDTTVNKGSIGGKIFDEFTKTPLSRIIVRLENNRTLIQTTETDLEGKYKFNNITPGIYSIEIYKFQCNSRQRYNNVLIDSNFSYKLDLLYDCNKENSNYNFGNIVSDAAGNTTVRGNRADGQQTIIDGVRVRGGSSVSMSYNDSEYSYDMNRTPGRSIGSAISSSEGVGYSNNSGFSAQNNVSGKVNLYRGKNQIELKSYNPDANYLKDFKNIPLESYYSTYLSMRNEYLYTPSFYTNIAQLFYENGLKDSAFLILSNLIEISNENFQIVQEYGNKLIEYGFYKEAIPAFKYIIELRSEFPQSYRDYALACEKAGRYQEALDTMNSILSKNWNRFNEIKMVVFQELNALIISHKDQLDISEINPILITPMPVKLRVVISWNTDNCDIDLHVIEPNGVDCYYQNKYTSLGGRLTFDVINGFGPEEYMIKNNVEGIYEIKVKYFNSRSQSQLIPVVVYADVYTDFGSINQQHKRISLKLDNIHDIFKIGTVEVDPID